MNVQDKIAVHDNILAYESPAKLLKMFAWPAIISMLANSLYNIIDQIFIGHAVGYLGNAATTVTFPIVTVVLAVATLFGVGGSAVAAIRLGEGRKDIAEKVLNTVVTVALVIGIVMTIIGLSIMDPLLILFGATENTMEYSRQFGSVMILIIPVSILIIALANLARADGNPQIAMRGMVSGVILNFVLAPLFIFAFKWGVLGAAFATACAQLLSLFIFVRYFTLKSNMRLQKAYLLNPDWRLGFQVATLGFSSCILQSGATLLQVVMNNALLYYGDLSGVGGDLAISAMGVVMKVNMIVISICIGIGAGSQPIIGFNKGAGQLQRVKEVYLLAVKIASAVTIFGWLCCQFIPEPLLAIFGVDNPEFMDFAVACMRLFLGGVFLAGFQIISTSYFQATGQPLKASFLSTLRQLLLLLPLLIILPWWYGITGILYAGMISDFGSAMIIGIFMYFELKKLNQAKI
ncbi:MAG TPA: MATE family efflux transporter [Candidatus Avacidaminococcus intestinavium]|uniref:Multidrug export protein MepA n=1 Tax=Candidatus Avacidaminococcus intestinavium TaxID=2840684 RepID=A0A9D1MPC7_9FIRM|nr:MATE family efflux transporter [Candidatus Avacidaminococcus intestinavium]